MFGNLGNIFKSLIRDTPKYVVSSPEGEEQTTDDYTTFKSKKEPTINYCIGMTDEKTITLKVDGSSVYAPTLYMSASAAALLIKQLQTFIDVVNNENDEESRSNPTE